MLQTTTTVSPTAVAYKHNPKPIMKSLFLTVLISGLSLCVQAKTPRGTNTVLFQSVVTTTDSIQNAEAKAFLNHTQVAISTARKFEKANNLTPSENLSVAERLAAHANTLFEADNLQDAIKCSRKARELATQAIASYSDQAMADKYTTFPTEQTPFIQDILSSDTTSLSYWIKELN